MADRRIDQLTEAEDISDEDLFVIWKENISQTRSIKKGTMNLASKSYVRDQNILSNWETITMSTNSSSPTVMLYDGALNIIANPSSSSVQSYLYLYRADTNGIICSKESANGRQIGIVVNVKKGDSLYLGGNNYGTISAFARYYKLRDYTGR